MSDDDDQPMVQVEGVEQMSEEQRARIASLQDDIEEIWSKKGNYQIDDEAWRSMPAFMNDISENDVAQNEACAALANLAYDNLTADEIAEDLKKKGNHNLTLALQPDQVNKANVARSAKHFYTEALGHKPDNRKLCCLLYSNRAQAHIIMANFGHGLEDSQRAIVLDPGFAKSYYRAALCAMKINKFDIAEKVLSHALNGERFVEAGGEGTAAMSEEQAASLKKLGAEVAAAKDAFQNRAQKIQREVRAGKAAKSNIMRRMQTYGVKIASKMEVSSEQWEQYGKAKPFFEKIDVAQQQQASSNDDASVVGPAQQGEMLHVPMLILWDEVSQSDFLCDVPTNACMLDVLSEVLPAPWNEALGEGKYNSPEQLTIFFKIDDGVKMPEHYSVDPSWELWEILRSGPYVMPGLVPTMHVVPKDSKLLPQFNLVPLEKALK